MGADGFVAEVAVLFEADNVFVEELLALGCLDAVQLSLELVGDGKRLLCGGAVLRHGRLLSD
jgi:hypothetical protein